MKQKKKEDKNEEKEEKIEENNEKNNEKNKEKNLLDLQKQISACRLCEEAFDFEPRPILFGNYNAKIMQIGQAPSKTVHETGIPFNDASGKKLREWYAISEECFYNPDNFYIASISHCYPGKATARGDRPPPKSCSNQWLQKQVELVQNEIFILIGRFAAEFFFPGEKLTSLVFKDKQINGKPAYILPHPSPLNIKWFKDNPKFMEERVFEIQAVVHKTLKI